MSEGVRRGLGLSSLGVAVLAGLTLFGVIRWSDALVCALMGQFAFGPLCVDGATLGLIGVAGLIAGVILSPWAPGDAARR